MADYQGQYTGPQIDAAIGKAHEHSNKELLDTYSQTEANLADAVSKKHQHSNISVLSGITSTLVTAWDAASTWVTTNGANVLSHIADTTIHVTSQLVAAWNAKYDKPASGIPKTDLASGVQTSLDKADTALQSQSLAAYRKSADQDVIDAGKQATISDLSTIRSGAALGATALQSVPSTYRTAVEQDAIHDSTKQDVISDLSSIRSGAALGATSLQPVSGSHTNEIVTLDSGGNVQASGKTVADVTDIIYGYMHSSTFYLTRTGSAGSYVYSDEVTPISEKQYTDKEGNVPYIWDGSAYQPIGGGGSEPVNETVTFNISSSDGLATLTGKEIKIYVTGVETPTVVTLDSNGQASVNIAIGSLYRVEYPIIDGYNRPADEQFAAAISSRTISKAYVKIDLPNSTRSIVLEESSSPIWTLGGNSNIVDNLLATYGTYVIDETNKKYARLDPANHSQFADGTAWTGTWGNAFRRLPRVYFMVNNDGNGKPNLYISPNAIEAPTKFWPETWIGTYKGSMADNKLWSRPNLATQQSKTMLQFWNLAQAQSTDYGLVNYFDHQLLNALHLCKYGTTQSENTMGKGLQDAGSSYYTHQTGTTASLGDTTGSAPYLSTAHSMNKLFGIEDLAGSTWEFRPNIRFSGEQAIIYEGNIVSNSAEGIRTFSRNQSLSSSYIKEMVLGNFFDVICKTGGGTASSYWCDGAWASSGGELLLVGGDSNSGSLCGLSASLSAAAFSLSDSSIGARLAFRGDISQYEFVTGAVIAALH